MAITELNRKLKRLGGWCFPARESHEKNGATPSDVTFNEIEWAVKAIGSNEKKDSEPKPTVPTYASAGTRSFFHKYWTRGDKSWEMCV